VSTSLTTFRQRIDSILSGIPVGEISEADRREALAAAVVEYSRDFPRLVVEDVTGDGGRYYELGSGANLTAWEVGFSTVLAIDYPAEGVSEDEAPNWLEREDWEIYRVGETRYLYFPSHTPSSSETARVHYTVRYALSDGSYNTPDAHFEAIATLAGAIACQWMAIHYGQSSESTIAADVVDRRSKSDIYASRARELRTQYAALMGIGGEVAPALAIEDLDMGPAQGRDFLFHGRRTR